jgi:hypothetical protein
MLKWGLFAFLWALALVVSMDFAHKSASGMSLQAYFGMDNPLLSNAHPRPSNLRATSGIR